MGEVHEGSDTARELWLNQHGVKKADDAKRLEEQEGGNARPKKLLAEVELDTSMLEALAEGDPEPWVAVHPPNVAQHDLVAHRSRRSRTGLGGVLVSCQAEASS
jgi:hypothetical protein